MSDVVLGSGEHRYRLAEGWGTLPDGWETGDVAGIGEVGYTA